MPQKILWEHNSLLLESRANNHIAFAADISSLLRVLKAASLNDASSLEVRLTMRSVPSTTGAVGRGRCLCCRDLQ